MKLHLHKAMTNQEISEVLDFISGVLELKGENRFRVRAYENAAASISQLPKELKAMFLTDADFDKVPGVGDTLNQKLTELFTTGDIKAFQKYVEPIPIGTFTLSTVHSIGVKKAYKIASHFDLGSEEQALTMTLKLAQQGLIRQLDGFGEKSEKDIITALQHHVTRTRIPYKEALQVAERVKADLIMCEAIVKVEVLGSLRRQTATVGDVDLGIAITDMDTVKSFVKTLKGVKRLMVAGDQLLRIQTTDDWQVDIKVSPLAEWGSFLQHFTGSKEHNIKLREYALDCGYSLSEHGIKLLKPSAAGEVNDQLKFNNEVAFYAFLSLKWIPPAERIGSDEIERYKM